MDGLSLYSGTDRRRHTTRDYAGPERRSLWSGLTADEHTLIPLIHRAVQNDRDAVARLYDRFVDKIYVYIYYRVGDDRLAENITAEVFIRVSESIREYDSAGGPFMAWLLKIADRLISDAGQDRSATKQETGNSEADGIRQAISQLDPEQQQVVILRLVVGYSTQYVASLMGKSPNSIRSLQHRALVVMKKTVRES